MLHPSSNVKTLQIIISAKMIYEYYVHNNSIAAVFAGLSGEKINWN